MNRRTIEKSITETGRKDGEFLIVSISYNEGGINYWNYKTEARGYYLHVSIETRERRDGYIIRQFGIGNSGLKHFLEPAARFNAKRMSLLNPDPDVIKMMVRRVLDMTAPKAVAV